MTAEQKSLLTLAETTSGVTRADRDGTLRASILSSRITVSYPASRAGVGVGVGLVVGLGMVKLLMSCGLLVCFFGSPPSRGFLGRRDVVGLY